MTTLPSFVELMASLGLDATTKTPDQKLSSPRSSPSSSPRHASITAPFHTRSKSSQSLREMNISRQRVSRYSPYSPVLSATRRGSLSSLSSSLSDLDQSPLLVHSTPSRPTSSRLYRRSVNQLSVNVYDSTCDLSANTPISTYVRRKTPVTSPTSPTFPREPQYHSPIVPSLPVSIPVLPPLIPNSASTDSFPVTPSDSECLPDDNEYTSKLLSDASEVATYARRPHRHTGIRISTPPSSIDLKGHLRRRSLAHIA